MSYLCLQLFVLSLSLSLSNHYVIGPICIFKCDSWWPCALFTIEQAKHRHRLIYCIQFQDRDQRVVVSLFNFILKCLRCSALSGEVLVLFSICWKVVSVKDRCDNMGKYLQCSFVRLNLPKVEAVTSMCLYREFSFV